MKVTNKKVFLFHSHLHSFFIDIPSSSDVQFLESLVQVEIIVLKGSQDV